MKQVAVNSVKTLSRQSDLPSLSEMVNKHVQLLNVSECKYMRTSDQKTLQIAENILKKNKFLTENVLGKPAENVSETRSARVKICDIRRNKEILNSYNEWASKQNKRILAIGGPAAIDQTVISSMIPEIKNNYDVQFYCKSYL